MAKDKLIQLNPIMLSEKEVCSLAWDRTVKKHMKAFILLGLLMFAIFVVCSLLTHLNHALQIALFFVGFFAWIGAMYYYLNPKYQAFKKELMEEWNKEVELGKS